MQLEQVQHTMASGAIDRIPLSHSLARFDQ